MARSIAEAWQRGELEAFLPARPSVASHRRKAVERAIRPLHPGVADVLERQNARFGPSPRRAAHLASLRKGAAAVVTGQQVGLFLGPLFTLYKAAAAIADARALAQETGVPVVPVFWLQTEDHDLPEIASVVVPDADGEQVQLSLPASPAQRISIAHVRLPEEVEACLHTLDGTIDHLPDGPAHMERLRRHYRPGAGWAEAFAGVLAEIFDELVIVDPRDPALAARLAPLHRRAIERAQPIAQAPLERSGALRAAGFEPAVHIRPDAPLNFFHPEGAEGPRYRLDPEDGGFAEVGGGRRHSLEAILEALERDPLVCSTSALLRPIAQDLLLPTAAYVGGPGEIAYFAQMGPVYEAFDLPMPLLVPRARFRILEGRSRRLLERLDLSPDDLALQEEELLERCGCGADLPAPDTVAASLLDPVSAELMRLEARLDEIGPGLERALRRTRRSLERVVDRFTTRYAAARLRRDERLVEDVRKLRRLVAPGGVPQERVHGLSWYVARHGERAFVEAVLQAVVPFDGSLRELQP